VAKTKSNNKTKEMTGFGVLFSVVSGLAGQGFAGRVNQHGA
jgi:hypothetical protein